MKTGEGGFIGACLCHVPRFDVVCPVHGRRIGGHEATEQKGVLIKLHHYGRIDRDVNERDRMAESLETVNGGHVLRKRHASLPKGYYFVAIEEMGSPVYGLAECPATGQLACIRLDNLFPEWCAALKKWLHA